VTLVQLDVPFALIVWIFYYLNLDDFQNDKEDTLSRFLVESKRNPEKINDQYLRDIILKKMVNT